MGLDLGFGILGWRMKDEGWILFRLYECYISWLKDGCISLSIPPTTLPPHFPSHHFPFLIHPPPTHSPHSFPPKPYKHYASPSKNAYTPVLIFSFHHFPFRTPLPSPLPGYQTLTPSLSKNAYTPISISPSHPTHPTPFPHLPSPHPPVPSHTPIPHYLFPTIPIPPSFIPRNPPKKPTKQLNLTPPQNKYFKKN